MEGNVSLNHGSYFSRIFCRNIKRHVFRQSNALDSIYDFVNATHMQYLYYVAAAGKWFIGEEAGGNLRRAESDSMEICAESLGNEDWFEHNGEQFIKSETVEFKCIDTIHCACRNLDISGLQYRRNGNGNYIMNNSTFDGRKCFTKKSRATNIGQ